MSKAKYSGGISKSEKQFTDEGKGLVYSKRFIKIEFETSREG